MGNLSNLYVSKSFQSLIHLGTDSTATTASTLLQDGFGNSIGIGVNTNGDLFLSGSLTASLQDGYVLVGGSDGKTKSIPTSSISTDTSNLVNTASFNAYTASTNQRVSSLETNSASVNVSISNINSTTASLNSSITQLNASSASQQVSINSLNTFSSSALVSFTNVNSATASLFTSVNNINTTTASLNTSASLGLTTASVNTNVITFRKGDGTTFDLAVAASGSVVPGTISSSAQITALGFVSSSVTASSLVTASFSGNTLTFTKGNGTTFGVVIPDVSGSTINTGSFATTGSNTFTGVQTFTQAVTASVITFPTGSFGNGINIFQDGLSQIRFYSGSTTTQVGTWVNMQTNPANGALAISSFPSNNHFVDFDVATTQSIFAAPTRFNNNVTVYGTFNANIPTASNESQIDLFKLPTFVASNGTTYPNAGINLQDYASVGIDQTIAIEYANSSYEKYSGVTVGPSKASFAIGTGTGYDYGVIEIVDNNNNTTTAKVKADTISLQGTVQVTGSLSVGGSPVVVSSQTASFATTGSNSFDGDQTLVDAAGNSVTLTDVSGSLMLVAKSFTSASAHYTVPPNQVNLIIKSNNNTADTIISGSNNIVGQAGNPTTGFRRYLSNSNLALGGVLPQISSSMAFSPTISSNTFFGGNGFTIRGPVSSSAYTITNNASFGGTMNLGTSATLTYERAINGTSISSNFTNATVNINAYKTAFIGTAAMAISSNNLGGGITLNADSSSITLANNTIQNAVLRVDNSYYNASATGGGNSLALQQGNAIFGTNTTIYASGSNTTAAFSRQLIANIIAGTFVSASVNLNGDNSNIHSTAIIGHGLNVTGSSALQTGSGVRNDTYGSAFFGRHNAEDGNRARTAETVFAIGTGTTTTPKTGFLIDSSSNTFIEGTLNVSGSLTVTGSTNLQNLTASLQQGFVYVGNASGITTTVSTSSFGGGGAAFPFTGDAVITGSLLVSGSTISDVRIIGNIELTGSMYGQPVTLSVAASTASMDMRASNSFILNIPTGSTTHIIPTNITAGQTINLLVKQAAGATTGSITFAPSVLFPSGLDMQATATGSAIDLVSMISFDTTNLMAANVKNLR